MLNSNDLPYYKVKLIRILMEHTMRYPHMTAQDAWKLCYQGAFGGGHLITDQTAAMLRLHKERKTMILASPDVPLFEEVGFDLVRLNLNVPDAERLSDDLILRMFIASAERIQRREDNTVRFSVAVEGLKLLAAQNLLPFSKEDLAKVKKAYDRAPRAMHHSAQYNDRYHPAYRVMEQTYQRLLPLLLKIESALSAHENDNEPVLVAIDGRAGSGKSSLAEAISVLYGCNVFHMDDFFLPFSMRTDDRLKSPGGNVHYERFRSEILDNLRTGQPFSFYPFDCGTGDLRAPVSVSPAKLNIIEGSYALHPYFGDAYDIRSAVLCSPEQQKKRLRRRDGEEMWKMFESRWIPMEETYFNTYSIYKDKNILVIDNE
ncbi:MAG: hypothetical protein IJ449_12565 [Clostridia bacterium]|nr:hypothetical protein [Clostridia bacterium]